MKKHFIYLFVLGLIGAKSKPMSHMPPRFTIGSETDTSLMTFDCQGSPPYTTLACSYVFVLLVKKKPDESMPKKYDDKTLSADLSFCETKMEKAKEEGANILKNPRISDDKKNGVYTGMELMAQICACRLKATAAEQKQCFADAIYESEKDSCQVTVSNGKLDFKKIGSRKWMSVQEPTGICSAFITWAMEHSADSDLLWEFTQTRIVGEPDEKFCPKGLENTQKFSWKYFSNTFPMICRNIEVNSW